MTTPPTQPREDKATQRRIRRVLSVWLTLITVVVLLLAMETARAPRADTGGESLAADRTMVRPDEFSGSTDTERVQAAVAWAVSHDYPSIALDRMYNLDSGSVLVDKASWRDRRQLKLVGAGGGFIKVTPGPMLSSTTVNTGDVSLTGAKLESVAGAGTSVFDADKLIRINASNNDYRNIDRLVRQVINGRHAQSLRFSDEHVVGGRGPAFEVVESLDVTLHSNLFEDRDAVWANLTPARGGLQNRNLRITSNLIENMRATPLRLGSSWTTSIRDNYFEYNGPGREGVAPSPATGTPAHIDIYSVQPAGVHVGLRLEGNMFTMSASQKRSKMVVVLMGGTSAGHSAVFQGNAADGGTLVKLASPAATSIQLDSSNSVEGRGDLIYPGQAGRVVNS